MTTTTAPLNVQGLVDLWPPAGQPGRHFDVLIVGSGYGGSVAAALLAGQTHPETGREYRIGLLERGKAYQPGEFPSQFGQLPAHTRLADGANGAVGGKADGLFDVHTGNDVVALVANGVGGGSLINAGVLLEPALEDFDGDAQMQQLIGELKTGQYYEQALRALGGRVQRNGASMLNTVTAFPGWDLPKTQALASLRGPHRFDCPPLSVSLDGQANAAGVSLPACNRCGDCLTGCNQGAKDSLDTNLLALASRHKGFQIYTGASVLKVKRQHGAAGWTVSVVHTHPTLQSRETGPLELTADRVILAAGALGSTEILLRSRSKDLALSPRLGERFSCNGDNIAAVYKLPVRAHAIADEDTPVDQRHVGPTITGSISMPGTEAHQGKRGFKLQEFSVPGALKHVAEELITTAALIQSLTSPDRSDHRTAASEANDPLAVSPDAMDRSLVIGIIGHDDAQGVLHLPPASTRTEAQPVPGVINIHWPHARQSADLLHAADSLAELVGQQNAPATAKGDQATVVPNPLWNVLPKGLKDLVSQPYGPVLTVHPLGGCSMGRDAADGVVDTEGRVYLTDPEHSSWFGSLVVLDGAILRGSLGVNPALTIAATAWRAMSRLVPQWAAQPASLPPAFDRARRQMLPRHTPSGPPTPIQPTEIEIVERLDGPVSLHFGHTLPQHCVLELTLAYEPFHIRPWLQQFGRTLNINAKEGLSGLRIYRASDWHTHQLRVQTDAKRHAHAIFHADVSGTLTVLNREPSCSDTRGWRALAAWSVNRGLRDFVQQFFTDFDGLMRRLKEETGSIWSIATRAGEVRLFEYELTIGTIHTRLRNDTGQAIDALPVGSTVRGHKRITYSRRANPWRQLTELTLTHMPDLAACSPRKLTLDPRFLAEQDLPLLRITRQHSLTRAWQDLASLGLLFTRVILSTHLWTFRKPDDPLAREPRRLPDTIAGLAAPHITELVVADNPQVGPVKIRLTHYRPPQTDTEPNTPDTPDHKGLPPLVMIHGYSVSGNTFTHPSLQPSAAEFFCRQGREVWVVDLRTSTGLPTATHPWSMEEVALVDIPAALTHIRQASQQPVDVLAHCIGCVMLSMAMLTTARDLRNGTIRLGADEPLTPTQLATLDAFNWRLPDKNSPHPCVRKVILSQKGPVLRYTDSNVFRGYLMQSIRRWVLNDGYQFRRSAAPSLAEELTDRLLASVPYPDEEYDTENPFWPPGKTLPWVGSRHRMDALYGRDFSVNRLRKATRDAIDDLFGPINMDTVAQTIHFTRLSTVTNQNGRGEFVTPERLHRHWHDVPTLAIHGQENGLVDVSTQDLLTANMRKAGVPFRAQPSDQPPYNQLGHQDVLIGTSSAQVFADMEAFLQEDGTALTSRTPAPPSAPPYELALPWLGPRLHANDGSNPNSLQIACMGHPAQGSASLMLVPVQVDGPTLRCSQAGVLLSGTPQLAESDEWLSVPAPVSAGGSATAHLAVLVYPADQTLVNNGDNWPWAPVAPTVQPLSIDADSLNQWMSTQPAHELALACVTDRDVQRTRTAMSPQPGHQAATSLVVCSCQFPASLIDALPAGASLNALSQQVEKGHIAAVLMLGDQIYADATAGLADPTRHDELFVQPHEKAYRFAPMRNLLRMVPVRTLPDDHEIKDNWEPLPPLVQAARPHTNRLNEQLRQSGMAAWHTYQAIQSQATSALDQPVDQCFVIGGTPVYMADSRNGRSARGSHMPAPDQHILNPTQFARLFSWMQAHTGTLHVVATSAMLLPRRRVAASGPNGHQHADSWDGFPASLYQLFDFMVTHRIQRTVFVSGDEHHSLFARITVRRDGHEPVHTASVHSSALYAPMPFANGHPDELVANETFRLGDLHIEVSATFAPPGDGFAVLTPVVGHDGQAHALDVAFHKAGMPPPHTVHRLSLD